MFINVIKLSNFSNYYSKFIIDSAYLFLSKYPWNMFNYLNISYYKFTDDHAAIQKWKIARSAMIYKDDIDR